MRKIMSSVILAVAVSFAAVAADRYDWVGGAAGNEQDFFTAENWTKGAVTAGNPPPYNSWVYIGAGNSVVVSGVESYPERWLADRLVLGYEPSSWQTPAELSFGAGFSRLGPATIGGDRENLNGSRDSAGRITVVEGNTVDFSGELILGFSGTTVTPRPRSYIVQNGGKVTGNSNIFVGGDGVGEVDVYGGEFQNGGWLSIGRYVPGEGYFNLFDGTLKSTKNEGILLGEQGHGELNVYGGVVDMVGEIRMGWQSTGSGVLNLSGGEIRTQGIVRYTGVNQGVSAIVNLNGGRLKMIGNDPSRPFFSNLTAVNLLENGVTFEIPAGYDAVLECPILDGTGTGGSGDLVKTGDGILRLCAGNTYGGRTVVRAGVVVLSSGCIDMDKLVLDGGSVALDVTGWSAKDLSDYISDATGDLALYVPAGTSYEVAAAIGASVSSIVKTGAGTLVLSGANAFSGDVRILGGVVKGDIGVGIPETASLKMLGGAWAPATGDSTAPTLGTGAGEYDAREGPIGFAAAQGASLAVNFGADSHVIQAGSEEFRSRRIFINPAPCSGDVTISNPFTVGGDFSITNAGGALHVAGISGTGGNFFKYGVGSLVFENGATLSMPGWDVNLIGGETRLDGGEHSTGTIYSYREGGLVLTNGASLAVGGQFLLGQENGSGAFTRLHGSDLSVNNWFVVGRFDGGPGRFEMDADSTLTHSNGGNFVVGNKGDGVLVNNGGTISTTRTFALGEWDNDGGRQYTGTVTMNGGSFTATSADDYIGFNGVGVFELNDGTVELKNLNVGQNGSATGTVTVTGGELTVNEEAHIGNAGRGVFVQSGGTVKWKAKVLFAHGNASSSAGLEMTGGEFVSPNVISFGRNGAFTGRISGGSVRQTEKGDMVFGRYASGSGAMTISGGELVYAGSSGTTYIGQSGTGTVSVTGTGLFAASNTCRVATDDTAVGRIALGGEGVVEVKKFEIGAGRASVLADGGTFRVIGSGATREFFDGTLDESRIGPGGVTFDTGDNTISIGDFASDGTSTGPLVKIGAGTLVVSKQADYPDGYLVNEGTLRFAPGTTAGESFVVIPEGDEGNVYPASPSAALLENDYLLNRWSFNGDWADSIGDSTAISDGVVGATLDANGETVSIPGGTKGVGAIKLGSFLLPTDGSPVTIEMWVRMNEVGGWKWPFAAGSNNGDYLAYVLSGDAAFFCVNNTGNYQFGNVPVDVFEHVALVVTADGDGGATVSAYRQDAATGATIAVNSRHYSNWNLKSMNQQDFWLGRSFFGDGDPNATYDEVRIWNAALSEAQLAENARLGTETLPKLTSEYAARFVERRATSVAAGATLDAGGNALVFAEIEAAGTLASGTGGGITVTGSLKPVGAMSIDGDVKVTGEFVFGPGASVELSGTLDLSDATLVVSEALEVPAVLVDGGTEGAIVGPLAAIDTGSRRLQVILDGSKLRVSNRGFVMMVR